MDRVTALKQERAEIVTKGLALVDKAATENRRMTEEELAESATLRTSVENIDKEISAASFMQGEREKAEQASAEATRRAVEATTPLEDDKKKSAAPTPFKSLGDQLAAVATAGQNPHRIHQGLLDIQAVALGSSEGVESDGGFLVQTDYTNALLEEAHETGVLLGLTDQRPISANANGMKQNAVDETSRVDGSRMGGIRAFWTAEAAALTSAKPKFRQLELNLQKLTGLYYATDEELKDVTALAGNVTRWFGDEFGFKIDDALIRGVGAGMPLGILGHAGTISIAKEAGQAAATVIKANIEGMYARMFARSVPRATWFINQDVWPQLFELSVAVGVGGVPLFIPSNSMANAPFGTLLGRPIRPIEHCETLGTVGDIILADWNEYITIAKGGIEAASSIHVQFLTYETAFRFILRMDGQPKRNAPITPFKGTKTQAPFLTLATRGP